MEAHISYIYASYVIDPQVYGLDASIWKTISGTPTVTSNKYRLNAAELVSYSQFRFGEFEFNATVPVAPAASDNRVIGLVGKSLGNRGRIAFVFNTSGECRAQVFDRYGVSLFDELVPFDATWAATATLFRIGWSLNAVRFTISNDDGTNLYSSTYQAEKNPLSLPMSIQILNGNADNLDISSVLILSSGTSLPLNGSTNTPGTSATSLGKAEDAVHTTGDTGVMFLGVANEAQSDLVSADGDYSPAATTLKGNVFIENTRYDRAVDNSNEIYWIHPKAIATAAGAVTKDLSAALEASSIAKATFGRLYRTMGRLDATAATATFYIQFLDSATLPADGAVTHIMAPIKFVHTNGTDQTWDIDLGTLGVPFNSGCVVVLSSTEFTKTIGGAFTSSTNLVG